MPSKTPASLEQLLRGCGSVQLTSLCSLHRHNPAT